MDLRGAFLLLAALSSVMSAVTEVSVRPGGSLELKPAAVSGPITSLLWKHNGDLVAEWDETFPLQFTGVLKDNAGMDLDTGVLRVRNVTPQRAGEYTVEINRNLQPNGFLVVIVEEVPQPEVELRTLTCNPNSPECLLTCHGDISRAGTVHFFWKEGEGEWVKGRVDHKAINLKGPERPQTYRCRMENSLGSKDSEVFKDPFIDKTGGSNVGGAVGGSLAVIGAVAALVAGGLYLGRNREPVRGWLTRIGLMGGSEVRPKSGSPETKVLMEPTGPGGQGGQNGQPASGGQGGQDGQPASGGQGGQDGQPAPEGQDGQGGQGGQFAPEGQDGEGGQGGQGASGDV